MPKAVSLLRLGGLDDDDERPRGAAESQTPADRVPLCWCSTAGCGTLMMIGPVLGHRVTFGTTEHKTLAGQLEECGCWHNETENAPVTVDRGGDWRGAVAQKVREPGTARSSRQPAPPLGTHRA